MWNRAVRGRPGQLRIERTDDTVSRPRRRGRDSATYTVTTDKRSDIRSARHAPHPAPVRTATYSARALEKEARTRDTQLTHAPYQRDAHHGTIRADAEVDASHPSPLRTNPAGAGLPYGCRLPRLAMRTHAARLLGLAAAAAADPCRRHEGAPRRGSRTPARRAPRPLRGLSEVLRGTPRYSEVLRGTPRYSEVPRGTQRYSEVLRGAPRYSEVLRGTPRYSEVLRGTPRYSEASQRRLHTLYTVGASRASSMATICS
jgi:hypothetical protein